MSLESFGLGPTLRYRSLHEYMTDTNESSALVFLHVADITLNNLLAQLLCGHVTPDAISFIS
jgi:hypothetical protein